MGRWRRAVTLAVLGVVASVMPLVPAGAASRTPLALSGFFEAVVDEGRGHLFLSQGRGSSEVAVTDLGGTEVARIPNLTDASGLTIAGDTLWVALPTTHAVAQVDTATLTEIARYALPPDVCPGSVAATDGYLAVGHSCNTYGGSGGYGSVGVLDPATGGWNDLGTGPFYQPYVASSPGIPGLVVAGDLGVSPTTLYSIAVVDGIPDIVTSRWNTGSNLRDLAIDPTGATVVQASGSPYLHNAYSLPFLEDAGSYDSTNYPNAVAWSSDGAIVATGTDSPYDVDVRIHAAGDAAAQAEFELAPYRLMPRGVELVGSVVLAITGNVYGEDLGLSVLPGPTPSTVEVPGAANATVGDPITLTGRLAFGDGTSSAGRTIEVRRSYADVDEPLGATTTDGTGAFEFVDTPVVATTITYTFRFAGEPGYGPASGSTLVTVDKRQTTLTIAAVASGGKGKNRDTYVVTARLGPTYTNRSVTITAFPVGGAPVTIAAGTVDAAGELSASYKLETTTTFVAEFSGDAWYQPASDAVTIEKKKGGGKGRK